MNRKYDAEKYGWLVKEREAIVAMDWSSVEVKRLARCQAWIYTDERGNQWLKSYDTVVAVYRKALNTLYVYGRWSSTTYQHVRKFRNSLPDMHYTSEVNIEYIQDYCRHPINCYRGW